MPQEQNVLKCFSCETFQVHIVKKSKKWECKICGAKQSFKCSYGQGSGKDCRLHVMKLNELRLKKESKIEELSFPQPNINDECDLNEKTNLLEKKSKKNKWLKYLDDDELQDIDLDCEEIALSKNYKKRKRINDINLTEENNLKKICNETRTSGICKLPHEISENNKLIHKIPNDLTTVKDLKGFKKMKNFEFQDEVKLENKKDLFPCSKKSSSIFNSNPSDLEDLINISF